MLSYSEGEDEDGDEEDSDEQEEDDDEEIDEDEVCSYFMLRLLSFKIIIKKTISPWSIHLLLGE